MKLVVLDPIYFDRRHIYKLKQIGKISIYNNLPDSADKILKRVRNADIVITASVNIPGKILKQCKSLKMICLACSGHNRIDMETCNKLGIRVTNVPSYSTEAVAEHTFALLLALLKKVREQDRLVRSGKFTRKNVFLSQLSGKVFGLVGTGRIGTRVARIASCFGCKVIANTLHPSAERGRKIGVQYVGLKELLEKSDIVSFHIPLNSLTLNLISYKEFNLMVRKPVLINTSRGKVINHNALVKALSKGIIQGAGLDVLPNEPPHPNDPLLKFPNVILSPHIAFRTPEALKNCADTVIENIEAFIAGSVKNKVNS